ncbi:hypothetical protein K7432_004003 [Basidiobolus ranarum]|uniref:RNA-binding protein 48 n=1 Tax=Basidiobolus ranarum TaxID=34480 RepID=A0ABR2W5N7_9FUNG
MQEEIPSRKKYRAGRRVRAVKVYTVNQESRYILIERVPALGNTKELLDLFSLYGPIEQYRILDDYPSEEYYDVYWIKYCSLVDSRTAKRKLDDYVFFGTPLQIRYCPEYETVEDTREKLLDRRKIVAQKTQTPDPLFDHAITERNPYPEAASTTFDSGQSYEPSTKQPPRVDHMTQSILNIREKLKQASKPGPLQNSSRSEPKKRRRI